MNKIIYFSLAIFMLLISACRQPNVAEQKRDHLKISHSFSSTFKPAQFQNDVRKERIKEIATKIQKLIEGHAKSKNIPGIAYGIVVDDELVVSSSTGNINLQDSLAASTSSSFRIASMTKSFTAMAILKLRDEGRISLEDPAEKYISQMSNLQYLSSDAPLIDIRNLLTMTAGFPEDNPWGDRQLDQPDEMLTGLMQNGVSFSNPPSYQFEYSNTGYALLGHIITNVTGMRFQDYIRENILLPLGMSHTHWEFDSIPHEQLALGYRWEDEQWKLEPMLHDGSYGSMGGLITSIEDFSKYVSFQLSAWPPRNDDENGPVKRSSLREMQTPQFCNLYANATDWNNEPCAVMSGYGFGLGISTNCNGLVRISHGGALPGFGSNYVFFPEYGVGLMAFCNLTYTSPWPLNDIQKLLFEITDLKPRILPVSDILKKRQDQIVKYIEQWDPALEDEILAANFYLDKSRERRKSEIQEVLDKAGSIQKVEDLEPDNQLRGRFKLLTENGSLKIFFTLTPEKDPKVQQLQITFDEKEMK